MLKPRLSPTRLLFVEQAGLREERRHLQQEYQYLADHIPEAYAPDIPHHYYNYEDAPVRARPPSSDAHHVKTLLERYVSRQTK
jgi:hypothetical protein